ncbi:hypothetical protein ACFXTO_034974 [Malus domestica]
MRPHRIPLPKRLRPSRGLTFPPTGFEVLPGNEGHPPQPVPYRDTKTYTPQTQPVPCIFLLELLVRTGEVKRSKLGEDHDSSLGVNEDRAMARPGRAELREDSELVSQRVADDESTQRLSDSDMVRRVWTRDEVQLFLSLFSSLCLCSSLDSR